MESIKLEKGMKVRTRGDMGAIKMEVIKVNNSNYCTCRMLMFNKIKYGKPLLFNLSYLEVYEW